MFRLAAALACLAFVLGGCDGPERPKESDVRPTPPPPTSNSKLATFGGGCFWCVEALFERVEGVESVESGYSGGTTPNPTYKQVCSGQTGHAEAVQVRYDPKKVAYETLLEIFWKTHDPTTPNRQGADVGTQYRSVVFFHDAEQERIAREVKAALDEAKVYARPIVTEIVPFERFWKAEEYHQGYYDLNSDQGYCQVVIGPKIEKLEKIFKDRLKKR
jgi:peptide-methionine (S)-S-oxide reductase